MSGIVIEHSQSDYLAPSQSCINPVHVNKSNAAATTTVRIELEDDNVYERVGQDSFQKLEAASITLEDCLACSGCVTSAETVLISLQSIKQLRQVLSDIEAATKLGKRGEAKTIVVSVAPQSRASIGAKYSLDPSTVHAKLCWFFKSLGINHVFDTAFSRDFALLESGREFIARHQNNAAKPMLASACPGWICYAEKTHTYLLPHVSSTKSPQQVMGSLVKDYFASRMKLDPAQIFHICVMPCFDKKLEASRSDFYSDIYSTRDVDCVITSGEVQTMLEEEGVDFANCPSDQIPMMLTKSNTSHELLLNSGGSSSGGYLSFILQYAAYRLFGISITESEIQNGSGHVVKIVGRNSDLITYILNDSNGLPLLKFASAYGFRNIQNIVRKVKNGSGSFTNGKEIGTEFDFVEVMACPSGCINGGGQLKNEIIKGGVEMSLSSARSKELVATTEALYNSVNIQGPQENASVLALYEEWLGNDSDRIQKMLHTQYHAVPRLDASSIFVNW